MDAAPSRRQILILSAVLLCAGAAVYANSFGVPFVLDDTASIVDNASIRRLFPLGPVLSPPENAGVGGRPIANLSFALNHAIGGLGVRGYHVANLAIHLAAGLALFGVVRRTLTLPGHADPARGANAALAAFVIALVWLVHPLQTEAVTYVSQRTESLMGLCYLLTLYGFIRGATERSAAWQVVAFGACLLGMATKEVMVTAPVVVLLYDRTFLAGTFRGAWSERKKVHLALASTWLLLLVLLVGVHHRGVGYEAVTWWQYALTECRAILLYLRLALWPAPLVFDYGTDVVRSPADAWPPAVGLMLLASAAAWALWRVPRAGFAAACPFILLAPTSSVVPVAGQPVAEHRMYLPLACVVALSVIALHRWFARAALAGLLVAATILGAATLARNADYRTAIALWTDTVAKRPNNARAHAALGAALLEKGDVPAAIASLTRAVRLDPGIGEAHNNLANALIDANRAGDAVAHFEAALRARPGTASTHYNFGNALLTLGRVPEAIAQQRQALILRPDFPEAQCALGNALVAAGQVPEGIASFRAALQRQPALVAAHYGLANALVQHGRATEAIPHFEAVLRAVPGAVDLHYNVGNVLLAAGRHAEARERYAAAVRLKPDFVEAHFNLAATCAALGQKADAIAHYEIVLELRPGLTIARTNLEALRSSRVERKP